MKDTQKEAPIFFFHSGYQPYLEKTISQAKINNRRVILFGDENNKRLDVEHYHINDYIYDIETFKNSYHHLSSNPAPFEIMCFLRWFVIRNFMIANDINEGFYIDSDVMLYSNITSEIEKKFKDKSIAILSPLEQPLYRWAASGHSSYWTRESLSNFCGFVNKTYSTSEGRTLLQGKWDHHNNNDMGGGICDMSLIWLFYNTLPKEDVVVLSEVIMDSTFDDNINSSENRYQNEYRMENNFKEVNWEDGIPFCYNLKKNKWIRFNTLHFQGHRAKMYI